MFWDTLYAAASLAGLAALAAGFAGRWHPAGDSFAVFRWQLALAAILWLGAGALAGIAPVWSPLLPAAVALPMLAVRMRRQPALAAPVTVYQKNMWCRMADTGALEADIRDVAPDILFLQEVTEANAGMLMALADILPSHRLCPYADVGGVAVASRWPVIEGSQRCGHGLAAFRVDTPDGPLWLVSVHLHWPWPSRPEQAPQVAELCNLLTVLDGPVVLGGDFNMVRWSRTVRRLVQASGSAPAGRVRPSFRVRGLVPLPIDNVLVPGGRRAVSALRPLLGSDHHGLLVRFETGPAADATGLHRVEIGE